MVVNKNITKTNNQLIQQSYKNTGMLTRPQSTRPRPQLTRPRPQPHEAKAEAEATTHEAEATHEVEAKTHLEILVIIIPLFSTSFVCRFYTVLSIYRQIYQ